MKKIFLMLVPGLFLFTGVSKAQETLQKFLGAETGMTFIAGKMSKMDYVRGELPSYPEGSATSSLRSLVCQQYVGVKPECFIQNEQFGFSAGLRFTQINSMVGKRTYWSNSSDFFYLLYKQEGVNTEYLKVKEISQSTGYLGIPLEIRFMPYRPRLFRAYFKLGAEVGFRLNTRTRVVFENEAMKPTGDEVAAIVGEPGAVSSSVYGAAGVRFGREARPSVSLEACVPSVYITPGSSGLVNPVAGFGFQLSVQIPIKAKTNE